MDINRLILILCLYQTVRCIYVAKDNDGEAASGRGTKSGGHDNTEENPTSQDIGLKYLDSLVQNIINHVPPVINVRGQRQREEYITDLRDKYTQLRKALDKDQTVDGNSSMTSFRGRVPCDGKDYSDNDSWRPEDRPFNRTTAWLRHTALRRLFLNTQSKCIQRIFNSTEISVNVERRAVLNGRTIEGASINSYNNVKRRIIMDEKNASCDYKTEREKVEDYTEAMTPTEVSTVTPWNAPEISAPATWWNSIWFWMVHLTALILLLILILSCCIWYCGSSNKRPDYIRI